MSINHGVRLLILMVVLYGFWAAAAAEFPSSIPSDLLNRISPPQVCALRKSYPNHPLRREPEVFCSAVLVGPKKLLSAGHCASMWDNKDGKTPYYEPGVIEAVCAKYSIPKYYHDVNVSKVVQFKRDPRYHHWKYAEMNSQEVSEHAQYDLAYLSLENAMSLEPAEILSEQEFLRLRKAGSCAAFGFSDKPLFHGNGKSGDESILGGVWLRIFDNEEAKVHFPWDELIDVGQSIWAYGDGSVAPGDSGGALMCMSHGRWKVAGVTSLAVTVKLNIPLYYFDVFGAKKVVKTWARFERP